MRLPAADTNFDADISCVLHILSDCLRPVGKISLACNQLLRLRSNLRIRLRTILRQLLIIGADGAPVSAGPRSARAEIADDAARTK